MTEKDLGRALLNLDIAPPLAAPDPQQMTQKILRRDRRWIRLLACLATLFWVLATAGIVWLCLCYRLMVTPRLQAYEAGRAHLQNDWEAWAWAGDVAAKSLLGFIIALLLAAISTVILILLSRRATLRQINASLVEISEQLKRMGQIPSGQSRGPTGPS